MWNLNVEPTLTKKMVGCSRLELTVTGSGGASGQMAITKMAAISQISVRHSVGTGNFTVKLFSDSSLANDVFSADVTDARMDVSNIAVMFQNTDAPQESLIYIQIVPEVDESHVFTVTMFYDKL